MAVSVHKINELRQQRAKLHAEAGAILEAAGENPGAEALEKFNAVHVRIDELGEQIKKLEAELDADLARREAIVQAREQQARVGTELSTPARVAVRVLEDGSDATLPSGQSYRAALRRYFEHDVIGLSREDLAALRPSPATVAEWKESAPQLFAAVSSFDGPSLGFLIPPEDLQAMTEARLAWGGMLQVADVITTDTGREIPYPTANDTGNEGQYTGESKTAPSGTDPQASIVPIRAFTCTTGIVKAPWEFLQDVGFNFEGWLYQLFGTRLGRRSNRAWTTGAGAGEPFGIVPAATLGKTGATGQTTSVTFGDLTELEHSVDPAYRPTALFMCHDSTIKALKLLKNGIGQPIWQPGVAVREPDTLNGYRYQINQDMAQMAASAKSILFGDFKAYKIRQVRGRFVRRLDERYADTGEVAFIGYERHDGRLIDAGTHPVKYYQNSAT